MSENTKYSILYNDVIKAANIYSKEIIRNTYREGKVSIKDSFREGGLKAIVKNKYFLKLAIIISIIIIIAIFHSDWVDMLMVIDACLMLLSPPGLYLYLYFKSTENFIDYQETNGFCDECKSNVTLKRKKPAHLLHLILSIITLGSWLIIWFFLILRKNNKEWMCSQCGGKSVNIKYAQEYLQIAKQEKFQLIWLAMVALLFIIGTSACLRIILLLNFRNFH
jgi:hypothetical protein